MRIFVLCLVIFFCRIMDVSLGTVRTIATVKGKKLLASMIGFGEVLVWFLVVREALNTDETSIWVAIAYAGGFATGTYVGGLIAKAFITSKILVQVITSNRDETLLHKIREKGFPITVADVFGYNHKNEKFLLMINIDSRKLGELKKIILSYDQNAFITIGESKDSINGYFANRK